MAFNPDMFMCAREACGFTQLALAGRMDVPQNKLSRIEGGLSTPDEVFLQTAATHLRCTPNFFNRPSARFHFSPILHRKQARLGVKALKMIHARIRRKRIEVERLLEATELEVSLPFVDVDRPGQSPQRAAQEIRTIWGMPRGPVANITTLIEEAGIVVVPLDFGADTISGLSTPLTDGVNPMIFISSNITGDRQRFTLAHELGHLVMHFQSERPFDAELFEAEADAFAAEFLAPADDIRGFLSRLRLEQAAQLKARWGISLQSVIRRARDLDQLSDHRYTSMMKEISFRGWRRAEPGHVPTEDASLFRELLETHLKGLSYTAEQLAELLYLPTSEIDSVLAFAQQPAPNRAHLRVVGVPSSG